MIKQELNILKDKGFMDMTDKKQVIEAALLDCKQSLQESYDLIRVTRIYGYDNKDYQTAKTMQNISDSLTILKLMTEESC